MFLDIDLAVNGKGKHPFYFFLNAMEIYAPLPILRLFRGHPFSHERSIRSGLFCQRMVLA